jgi:hypothetical protein
MGNAVQDIWIVQADGAIIFHRARSEEQIDPKLLGGFLSAIVSMAQMLDKTGIRTIQFGGQNLSIYPRADLLFIGSHEKQAKQQKVQAELESIAERFFNKYPPEVMKTWPETAIDDVTDEFLVTTRRVFK